MNADLCQWGKCFIRVTREIRGLICRMPWPQTGAQEQPSNGIALYTTKLKKSEVQSRRAGRFQGVGGPGPILLSCALCVNMFTMQNSFLLHRALSQPRVLAARCASSFFL